MELEPISIRLPRELVKKIRLRAVQEEIAIQELVAELLEAALKQRAR